jgi:hypothetical protein
MSHIARVLYAEQGKRGGVFDRLGADTSRHGGLCPYYGVPVHGVVRSPIVQRLEMARNAHADLSTWQWSVARRAVFDEAKERLAGYRVRYEANRVIVERARAFAAAVPATDPVDDTGAACPFE